MKVAVLFCVFISIVVALDPHWQLLWSDEFTGSAIDTNKWNVITANGNSGGEDERQYYDPSSVSVSGGNLVITITNVPRNGFQYTSGRVEGKYTATFGRWEVRAQMPVGHGIWPAHWALSSTICWPVGAELDIMEYRGSYPNNTNGYYQYGDTCAQRLGTTLGRQLATPYNLGAGFHVYAIEWNSVNITWIMDDVPFLTVSSANLTHNLSIDTSPHYWVLNSAVGGYYPGYPDNTNVWPTYHYVDYVRIYQWANLPTTATTAAAASATTSKGSSTTAQTSSTTAKASGTTAKASGTTAKAATTGTTATTSATATTSKSSTSGSSTSGSSTTGSAQLCPASNCGVGQNCCNTFTNGPACYDTNNYACITNDSGQTLLCLKGYSGCGAACYDPAAYKCVNGNLQPV